MSAPAVGGLASIIVPCWNQLEFTRKCISALMRVTGLNSELVVSSDVSTEATKSRGFSTTESTELHGMGRGRTENKKSLDPHSH
jgi:hypothetical protein